MTALCSFQLISLFLETEYQDIFGENRINKLSLDLHSCVFYLGQNLESSVSTCRN